MLKKIKNLKNYNGDANIAFVRKLEQNSKFVQPINLLINLAYKLKQKVKKKPLGNPSLGFGQQNVLFNKNVNLFSDSILIIAELSIPQCTKYRVTQKAEMLRYLGRSVNVVSWHDEALAHQLMQTSGIIIFYRVPAFEVVIGYFELARALGVATYYDVDGLIFDVERLKENKSLTYLPPHELNALYDGATLYHDAMLMADYGIASTIELARQMQLKMKKPVYLLNNAIDAFSLAVAKPFCNNNSKRVQIVYGSGTNTHNEDFLVAADAILAILEVYSYVDFIVYGYLDLDSRFDKFSQQIFKVPFVSSSDYYRALGSCDISIAPLSATIFNDCKSNIKFTESALYKIPCVCSDVAEFNTIVQHGKNGFIVHTTSEWYDALSSLVTDCDYRQKIAEQAYFDVIDYYHWQKIATEQCAKLLPIKQIRKKRILLTNILFTPDSFGGATVVVENIAQLLKNNSDAEVLVFCGTFDSTINDTQLVRYEINGIDVIKTKVSYGSKRSLEYDNPDIMRLFADIVLAWQPDLVHFHSIQLLGASLANVCIEHKIPYIITLHDAWWFCERQFMINAKNEFCHNYEGNLAKCASCVPDSAYNHQRRFYLFDIISLADLLLAPSQFQKELYIRAGFDESKIKVNKNGVLKSEITTRVTKNSHKITFAYLGGKAVHKGYFWLQEIFAELDGDFILRLVDMESRLGGNGASAAGWSNKTKGNIEIVPFFDQTQLDDFFEDIDVLLFPSLGKESFGLTIREAMLRDVWVVTTDCGGPAEDIIDGVNGNLIPFGDKLAFINALRNILDHPLEFINYVNPIKEKIVTIEQQVLELKSIYFDMLNRSLLV